MSIEHRTVIIVGGGPAGLAFTAVFGGWHPYYSKSDLFCSRYPQLDDYLKLETGSLLGLNMKQVSQTGVLPADLFRLLHHPGKKFRSLNEIAYTFRKAQSLDYLLITQENVGGLWNNVPRNLLTLSPGQWMEFGYYPLAQHAQENNIDIDVNDLIIKHDLITYYHAIPKRFEQTNHIHTEERVTRVEPHEKGFLITSQDISGETTHQYTCKYLIYAVGQRSQLRRLGVPGDDLPIVSKQYEHFSDYPGQQIIVVGGGRSADWAATELHDAGRHVHYVMRQPFDVHWRLITDSRYGLPYYARIAELIETKSPRFSTLYHTEIKKIEKNGHVTLQTRDKEHTLLVDHIITEIGGSADYSPIQGFNQNLTFIEKYDAYRFQVHQVATHPHNHESVNIPNFYPGGYLAQGIGLVVFAMHGTTYAIAGDIMQKEGLLA
jgi:thioredoxin reductase